MQISQELRMILTVDEDPIFGQVIFTLFRVAKQGDFNKTYHSIAKSLYQDLFHQSKEIVLAS